MKLTSLLTICLALVLFSSCGPKNKHSGLSEAASISLDSLLQATVSQGQTPGVAIAIVSTKEVLYNKAFGKRSIDQAEALQTTDVFNFSSIVKTVMSTAIMQQVEREAMALDKSAHSYWPAVFEGSEAVTIRQMLSHSSGIEFSESPLNQDGNLQSGSLKLTNIPGYKLKYSNAAFYTLGRLIEHQNNIPFPDYISANIFNPLGMNSSSVDNSMPQTGLTTGHTVEGAQLKALAPSDPDRLRVGNGIFYSSIDDMAIWAQMHLNKGRINDSQILNSSSYEELWKPNLKTGWDDMKAAAGLGCFIGTVKGRRSVSHIGGGGGYSAAFVLLPDEDRAIIIASNSDKLPREVLIEAIAGFILK